MELNEIETKKIDETKSWFLGKIKLTNFQLDSPRKKERGLKVRNERGVVIANSTEMKRII